MLKILVTISATYAKRHGRQAAYAYAHTIMCK